MLCETAAVVRHDGKSILLKTNRRDTCGGCSLKGGCGQYLLARDADCLELSGSDLPHQLLQEKLGVGDQVQISMDEGQLLRLVALFYGFPLLGVLLATLLASLARLGEGGVVLSALGGFGGGIVLSRLLAGSSGIRHRVSPRITRVPAQGAIHANSQWSQQ
jgi:sigma-E factor negative regulatory protein RseC